MSIQWTAFVNVIYTILL